MKMLFSLMMIGDERLTIVSFTVTVVGRRFFSLFFPAQTVTSTHALRQFPRHHPHPLPLFAPKIQATIQHEKWPPSVD